MSEIAEQKMVMTDSFHIFGGSFLPISSLKYRPNTISRKIPVKAIYGVHFIHAKVGVRVAVKE